MITREQVISEPGYWVEELNGKIYDAIVRYMEARSFKQKDMAKYLDISAGRMSQILNSGDINFSYSKIVSILLRLDLIPHFELESKSELLKRELHQYAYVSGLTENKPFKTPDAIMKVVASNNFSSTISVRSDSRVQEITQVREMEHSYDSKSANSKRQIA